MRDYVMITERLQHLINHCSSFGRLSLRFIAAPPMCAHRVTAERIGLAANSALD